jgi:hypothetical protein
MRTPQHAALCKIAATPRWHRWSACVMQQLTSWFPPRRPTTQATSARPATQLPGYSSNWTHLTNSLPGHDGYWVKRATRAGSFVLYVHDPSLQATWYCQFLNPHDRRSYIDQLAGRRSTGTANAIIVRIHPDGAPVL